MAIGLRLALALGVALLATGEAAIAQDDWTYIQVGGWEIYDGPGEDMDHARSLRMVREVASTNFVYEAFPGGEREIRISNDDCTWPMITDGRVPGRQTIRPVGGLRENLAAARASYIALAASIRAQCPAPAVDLAAALGDFDAAFTAIENRLASNPFPRRRGR